MGAVAAAMPAPTSQTDGGGLRATRHETVSYVDVLKRIAETKVVVVHSGEDIKQVGIGFFFSLEQ